MGAACCNIVSLDLPTDQSLCPAALSWPPHSFLLQLAMLDWPLAVQAPSRLAAGVLSAALSAFGRQPWCPALARSMLVDEQVRLACPLCVWHLGCAVAFELGWAWGIGQGRE